MKDCSWFPFNSTIIACCLFDGSIQLWDLQKNRKDPLIHYQEKGVQFTSIEFAQNSTSIYAVTTFFYPQFLFFLFLQNLMLVGNNACCFFFKKII